MNSKKPFSKRMPTTLSKRARIAIEAIDIATDIAKQDLDEMNNILYNLSNQDCTLNIEYNARISLFKCAWSIVDRICNIGHILSVDNWIEFEKSDPLHAHVKNARVLRNKMDHLPSNIFNISNKINSTPIFGVITCIWTKPGDIYDDEAGNSYIRSQHAIMVSGSALHHDMSVNGDLVFDDTMAYSNIGGIKLFAFDKIIEISKSVESAIRLQEFIDTHGEARWLELEAQNPEICGAPIVEVPENSVIKQTFDPIRLEKI